MHCVPKKVPLQLLSITTLNLNRLQNILHTKSANLYWNYTIFLFNNNFSFSSTAKLSVDRSTVSSICRRFTVVSDQCLLGNSASNLFVPYLFSCRSTFLSILSCFDFILQILCVFVNKIGRHIDVNCQYATWTTDLIFDSDFYNKKWSPDFDVNWHNHCRLMSNHAAKRLLIFVKN